MVRTAILRAMAESTAEACQRINEETAARTAEAYKNACAHYFDPARKAAYLAKLDEIHETAMRLMGRK